MNETGWNENFLLFPRSTSALIVLLLISCLGIITNLLLLTAHVKDPYKILSCPSSYFIVNIAIIDFLTSSTLVLFAVLHFDVVDSSIAGTLALGCNWFITVSTTASVVTFFSLAVDRFASVAFSLWHRVRITNAVYRRWLAILWFAVLSVEGTLFGLFSHYPLVCGSVQTGILVVSFVLTQSMYLALYISLRTQRRGLFRRTDLTEVQMRAIQARLNNEKNFLSTIFIVCFIFALTFVPMLLFMFALMKMQLDNSMSFITTTLRHVAPWAMPVIASNYAFNGFIYVWRWPKYHKTFKKLYCML